MSKNLLSKEVYDFIQKLQSVIEEYRDRNGVFYEALNQDTYSMNDINFSIFADEAVVECLRCFKQIETLRPILSYKRESNISLNICLHARMYTVTKFNKDVFSNNMIPIVTEEDYSFERFLHKIAYAAMFPKQIVHSSYSKRKWVFLEDLQKKGLLKFGKYINKEDLQKKSFGGQSLDDIPEGAIWIQVWSGKRKDFYLHNLRIYSCWGNPYFASSQKLAKLIKDSKNINKYVGIVYNNIYGFLTIKKAIEKNCGGEVLFTAEWVPKWIAVVRGVKVRNKE